MKTTSIILSALVLFLIVARMVVFNYNAVVMMSAVMTIVGFTSVIMAAFAVQKTESKGSLIAAMIISSIGIISGAYHVVLYLLGQMAATMFGK